MRLPDELRRSFNREQVALEEYISNSYYSCEDKEGIEASWLEAVLGSYYQAQAILRKYSKLPDGRLLPFIPAQQYNERIREVLRIVGIDRMVTIIDPLTGKEDKKPICEVAASHMARRTFIGNLYKKVQDPNIVASLSGHVEGSRAFSRYREIDKEIKTNVVKLLDD